MVVIHCFFDDVLGGLDGSFGSAIGLRIIRTTSSVLKLVLLGKC